MSVDIYHDVTTAVWLVVDAAALRQRHAIYINPDASCRQRGYVDRGPSNRAARRATCDASNTGGRERSADPSLGTGDERAKGSKIALRQAIGHKKRRDEA